MISTIAEKIMERCEGGIISLVYEKEEAKEVVEEYFDKCEKEEYELDENLDAIKSEIKDGTLDIDEEYGTILYESNNMIFAENCINIVRRMLEFSYEDRLENNGLDIYKMTDEQIYEYVNDRKNSTYLYCNA